MLKRVLTGMGAALILAVAAPTVAQAQLKMPEKPKGKEYAITGTVIDFSCKFQHGLSGADHRMCAQVCADKGVPLAILTSDGQVYLPIGAGMPGAGQNDKLKESAEQEVRIQGTIYDAAGAKANVVKEIQKA
jgi:hypothetical protein